VRPARAYATAVWAAVWFAVVSSMAGSLCAQEAAARRHTGVPQDWSQNHIVFSRNALVQHPELINQEPRVFQQAMQRWQAPNFGVFDGSGPVSTLAGNSAPHSDWKVTLGGAHIAVNGYPAKFSFSPAAPPDCINDYVVFGLNSASTPVTGTLANLVAFNNLYAGTSPTGLCGTAPTVLFAYNITTVTGGHIVTSPVISDDGLKIAFVESVPGAAAASIFHVLTWTAGQGAIGAAVAPTNWVSLPLPLAKNDTTSSPWVDYPSDTAYVGSANGALYKITGVFYGTPTLVVTSPWPVTVVNNSALTSPVLDRNLGMLMVGAANGNLYQVNAATGVVAHLRIGQGFNSGIVAAPIVDVTNGTTFVVSSNCGNSCPAGVSLGAVLAEVDTATLTLLAEANIGQGSSGGHTRVNLYQPALDNDYYNSNFSTAQIHLCGTGAADTTPWQYAFGFTAPVAQPIMNTTASVAQALPTNPANSTAARCTGWTEFFNPNIGAGPGTDFFFFGLSPDCNATGAAGGCVEEIGINGATTTTITNTINGGPTGIVVDNYANSATYPQASSIYFVAESVSDAYKLTQNGLQ